MNKKRKSLPLFPIPPNIQTFILFLILGALIAYYACLIQATGPTTFDDAYMFIRYANNFLNGYGIAWNPDGIQTYGTTSILYFIIITLTRFFFQHVKAGILLTIVSAGIGYLAILIITYTCSRFATLRIQRNSFLIFAIIFTGFFLISPLFLYHMSSGMDTALSFLCNSFLIFTMLTWLNIEENYRFHLYIAVIAAYMTYLARPDNIFYVFLFPILAILLMVKTNKKQRLIHFLGILFLILLADTSIKFLIFHDPFPLSFYAKSNGYYQGYAGIYAWNPIDYLFEFGGFVLPFLIIIILFLKKETFKLFTVFIIPLIFTFGYYFFVVQIMGYEARYYFPGTSYVMICSFLMLEHHVQSEQLKGDSIKVSHLTSRLFVILFTVTVITKSTLRTNAIDDYKNFQASSTTLYSPTIEYSTPAGSPLPQRGRWSMLVAVAEISKALPNGTKFAQSEYGYTGAMAETIEIIDLVGLNDPYFAHKGFSVNELLNRKPDLIWFPHSDYTKIISEIVNSRGFWEQYEYYPDAFNFGIAIRKESPKHDEIVNIVDAIWRETYFTRRMKDYLANPIIR